MVISIASFVSVVKLSNLLVHIIVVYVADVS